MAHPSEAPENAQNPQNSQNAHDAEGEAARHALRRERQAAIREGRYLPPLPNLPIRPLPHRELINAAFDRAMGFQMHQNREFMMNNMQPNQLPGFYAPRPEDNYRPLSPQNSDDEAEEAEEVIEQQRNIRRNWRHYMNMRQEPIPQEIVDRLLRENDQIINEAIRNNNNNNNNANFRNFNGMLSPSLSPSPGASPAPSENGDPIDEAREIDQDIEMLNAQMVDLRPSQPKTRKRQNMQDEVQIKKKRVTFKEETSDEAMNTHDEHNINGHVQVNRKQFDDDDEGFIGGPPAQQNIFCA